MKPFVSPECLVDGRREKWHDDRIYAVRKALGMVYGGVKKADRLGNCQEIDH